MSHTRAALAECRKSQILDVALLVFSRKGFDSATNRDIAEAAGIASPGLIYHYFRDKHDLLVQLFKRVNPLLQILAAPEALMEMPLREGLLQFSSRFLELSSSPERVAALRLFIGEALRDPTTSAELFEAGPERGLGFLATWLERHIEQGTLRPVPPHLLARQFMGPLLAALLFRVIFRREDPLPDGLAELCVDTFLRGAAL